MIKFYFAFISVHFVTKLEKLIEFNQYISVGTHSLYWRLELLLSDH